MSLLGLNDSSEKKWESGFKRENLSLDKLNSYLQPYLDSLNYICEVKSFVYASYGLANTNLIVTLLAEDNRELKEFKVFVKVFVRDPYLSLNKEINLRKNYEINMPKLSYYSIDKTPYIAVYEYIDGISFADLLQNDKEDNQVLLGNLTGEHLAKVHSNKLLKQGLFDENLNIVDLPDSSILNYLNSCLDNISDKEFTSRVLKLLNSNKSIFFEFDVMPAVLLHGDYKPSNLLLTKKNGLYSTDWEFAFAGPNLFDIGQLFRFSKTDSFTNAFKEAYQNKGGFLAENWLYKAKLIDLINLLTFLKEGKDRPTMYDEIKSLVLNLCIQ